MRRWWNHEPVPAYMAAFVALAALLAACDNSGTGPEPGSETAFPGITETAPVQVDYTRDTVRIKPEGTVGIANSVASAATGSAVGADGFDYTILQVGAIPPVVVQTAAGDVTVQANDIVVDASGRTAFIAYNYQGDPWIGGLQVVDMNDKDHPVVVKQFAFQHMDINALYLDGTDLLIAGAADPAQSTEGFRSFVARVDVDAMDAQAIATSVHGLPSYAATGVTRHGTQYYVSVGALDGSIEVLDADLSPVDRIDRQDVRDVAAFSNGIVALAGTTDNPAAQGDVIVARDGAMDAPVELPIVDFGSDYHKATIQMWQGTLALLGLSEAGWKVLDPSSPSGYLAEVPNPDAPECDPATGTIACNTNSVSTDGNFIFTANGEYGFRVFRPHTKNDLSDVGLLGFYRPDQPVVDGEAYTANHIEMKSTYLFVASGARGAFVYSIEKSVQ